MARILITGGAGFIGSNLIQALHANGDQIAVLDTLSEQVHGENPKESTMFNSIREKVDFIHGSVCDRDLLGQALKNQDVVVHLAAETGTGQSMYQVEHYTATNIGGTALMLDLLANQSNDVKRVVIASSRSIYGEGKYLGVDNTVSYPKHRSLENLESGEFNVLDPETSTPLNLVATDETSKIHPSSVYGITKQVQEQLVMTVCPLLDIEPVALRYQNVYGPGQSLSNPYTGILSIFANLIMNEQEINIFEDGLESRDFVYIDDAVTATMLAIKHEKACGMEFNVGSGIPTDVNTVTSQLLKNFGIKVPVTISGNFRLGDIRHNFADLERIRNTLGFEPSVPFEKGIEKFVNWARTLGPKPSAYEKSLDEMKERGLLK